MTELKIETDAWASGQTGSKKWLVDTLEYLYETNTIPYIKPFSVSILACWYGTLIDRLFSSKLPIDFIRGIDIDPQAIKTAEYINNQWHWLGKAHFIIGNINDFNLWNESQVIINTSLEHLHDTEWWNGIELGKLVILQSNNMPHKDHVTNVTSYQDIIEQYPMTKILYKGSLRFKYPDWSFDRFMVIGFK